MSDPFIGTTYDPIASPPTLAPPTSLAAADGGNGAVHVTLTQGTVVTTRGCFVELSFVSGDYTNAYVVFIPVTSTRSHIQVGASGTVYVRARSVDMWGNVSAYANEVSGSVTLVLDPGFSGLVEGDHLRYDAAMAKWENTQRIWAPLTSDTGGTPELVWDADNALVMTETP